LRHSARSVRARHALEFRCAFHRQERVEHRRGTALEQPLVADVQQLVDREELAVDRTGLGRDGNSRACRFCSRITLA